MKVVIFAAGQGSRLGELSRFASKPTLPLLGKPLITRVRETFAGIATSFVVVANRQDPVLISLLSKPPWNRSAVAVAIQEEPLGSADALRSALPYIDGPCLVTACDNIMEPDYLCDFLEEFSDSDREVQVAVMEVEGSQDLPGSTILQEPSGVVSKVIEKPAADELLSGMTMLPLYAFNPVFYEVLEELERSERGEYELPQAIQVFIDRGGAVIGKHARDRITINTSEEYLGAVIRMLEDKRAEQVDANVLLDRQSVRLIPPYYIEREARIGPETTIGPNAYLMTGARVSAGSSVRDSIVFRGAEVGEGACVDGRLVLPTSANGSQKFRDNPGPIHHQ